MTIRVGINGMGRIGRLTLRAALDRDIDVVAVNDVMPVPTMAHLLRYDSTYGRFPADVTAGDGLLYEKVLTTAAKWGSPDNLMYVIGATQADEFTRIRELTPAHFYLVPGVGAQGGSLEAISKKAMNADIGLLVNASRAVIYASNNEDFAEAAAKTAKDYSHEMKHYLTLVSASKQG